MRIMGISYGFLLVSGVGLYSQPQASDFPQHATIQHWFRFLPSMPMTPGLSTKPLCDPGRIWMGRRL